MVVFWQLENQCKPTISVDNRRTLMSAFSYSYLWRREFICLHNHHKYVEFTILTQEFSKAGCWCCHRCCSFRIDWFQWHTWLFVLILPNFALSHELPQGQPKHQSENHLNNTILIFWLVFYWKLFTWLRPASLWNEPGQSLRRAHNNQ